MKFEKKPIVVEAFQMTEENQFENSDWPYWLINALTKKHGEVGCLYTSDSVGGISLYLTTLEGRMSVSTDDWIIQGVKGELYSCKPDVFALTYTRVE